MFNLGMGEITVILLLALIFLGPSKLPELATGLGKLIRQIRKATADVKNEIVLDDTFRKPFEELRDAVTLSPEELKRRDQIKENAEKLRRELEELERKQAEAAAQANGAGSAGAGIDQGAAAESAVTPPPVLVASDGSAPWTPTSAPPVAAVPPPPPPPAAPTPPGVPPIGTFPRSATPTPFPPGRLGGPQRVTPPISSQDSNRANITQVLSEEDLLPASAKAGNLSSKGAPPPLPPPLPGVPPLPPANVKKS
jgi:sec-independent protein translocase protein TatB